MRPSVAVGFGLGPVVSGAANHRCSGTTLRVGERENAARVSASCVSTACGGSRLPSAASNSARPGVIVRERAHRFGEGADPVQHRRAPSPPARRRARSSRNASASQRRGNVAPACVGHEMREVVRSRARRRRRPGRARPVQRVGAVRLDQAAQRRRGQVQRQEAADLVPGAAGSVPTTRCPSRCGMARRRRSRPRRTGPSRRARAPAGGSAARSRRACAGASRRARCAARCARRPRRGRG